MRNLYFYGASDDLCEVDCPEARDLSDEAAEPGFAVTTSYVEGGVAVNWTFEVRYAYDGDWAVWVEGELPPGWTCYPVGGNMAHVARPRSGLLGSVLHMQVPDGAPVQLRALDRDE